MNTFQFNKLCAWCLSPHNHPFYIHTHEIHTTFSTLLSVTGNHLGGQKELLKTPKPDLIENYLANLPSVDNGLKRNLYYISSEYSSSLQHSRTL